VGDGKGRGGGVLYCMRLALEGYPLYFGQDPSCSDDDVTPYMRHILLCIATWPYNIHFLLAMSLLPSEPTKLSHLWCIIRSLHVIGYLPHAS